MSVSALSQQVRQSLEEGNDNVSLDEKLNAVDDFVIQCSSCEEPEVLLFNLEEELQTIHNELVDHTSLYQTEIFLSVLYRLRPLLSSTSVISTWFDLVLRPALREPRLPTPAVSYAKELVIFATERIDERHPEKLGEFRRRLLDLYLLDAYNEGSGDDILEWAGLDQGQREKRSLWKCNLEDILVRYGLQRPQDLMAVIHSCFVLPSSRLQLLTLLNRYTSEQAFQPFAAVLADHPLMDYLLNSLLLDNSSTVCTIGITVLVKLLPIFAVQACEHLKVMLPRLLAILARIICWKERSGSPPASTDTLSADEDFVTDVPEVTTDIVDTPTVLALRSDLLWERLELTFNVASSAPPSGTYFSFLYYLFPCNLLRFFRAPAAYLNDRGYETPYTVSWDEALDEDNIRSKSEFLLRGRIVNPRVIWRDWKKELSEPDTWANYNVPRIASECMMLDVHNTTLGIRQTVTALGVEPQSPIEPIIVNTDDTSTVPTPHPGFIDLPTNKPRVSLQSMIDTSVILKSNIDVDIDTPRVSWSSVLFPFPGSSPSKSNINLPESSSFQEQEQLPSHVVEAISALQREVLLLRNELNFELWLSRENIQHIGRLHQDRILSKNAEVERQGLYNKLRQYKAQVQSLDRELREHKEQSSSAKNKYADWNTELQKKLREFREEKKSWISEATTLRNAEKESKALFAAQGKLLADAAKEVFELQTQKKENQHKIDRLRDYERQIEQSLRMQKLWDADFAKFNERAEEMQSMMTKYKQMELRLESYEKSQTKMEDDARCYRRQNQALEARLVLMQKKNDSSRHLPEAEIASFVSEKAQLTNINARLREENADLKDEIEEMRAMLEVLKGRKGLVSEPRSSPTLLF
ncbi:hypothetical protein BJ138DRAFT_242278 [Hygrophoropsis aurantiaca]|uniref:Uncharacterized protein n=1 Tax=Hygrophoropsis aurantiaca TaxID=72124 RepID=A0ACB8AP61_9AGAM|nr:hypothetical protein BJ138DRAFT_242278 [Hygrophoropsis aurantiaca]